MCLNPNSTLTLTIREADLEEQVLRLQSKSKLEEVQINDSQQLINDLQQALTVEKGAYLEAMVFKEKASQREREIDDVLLIKASLETKLEEGENKFKKDLHEKDLKLISFMEELEKSQADLIHMAEANKLAVVILELQLLEQGARSDVLEKQLLERGARSDILEQQLLERGGQSDILEQQLLERGARSVILEQQLLEQGARSDSLQSDLDTLSETKDISDRGYEELERVRDELKASLEVSLQNSSNSQVRVLKLESQVKIAQSHLAVAIREREEILLRNIGFQKQVNELGFAAEKMSSQLTSITGECDQLSSQLTSITGVCDQLTAENLGLKSVTARLERELGEREGELVEGGEALEAAKEQIKEHIRDQVEQIKINADNSARLLAERERETIRLLADQADQLLEQKRLAEGVIEARIAHLEEVGRKELESQKEIKASLEEREREMESKLKAEVEQLVKIRLDSAQLAADTAKAERAAKKGFFGFKKGIKKA